MDTKIPPRIPPIDPPYETGIRRTLERMMGGAGMEPLRLFRTVAHNPNLLDKLRSTGSYLLNFGTVEPAEREIVILRTCARCRSEYEWGVHVAVYGKFVGLTQDQISATVKEDSTAGVWSDRQSLLVRLVDELHDTSEVSDVLWSELERYWTHEQLVELVTLVGQYHGVAFVTNALRIEREEFAARFPIPGTNSTRGLERTVDGYILGS
jgi:alkylhydroperoxidase family enzyme